MIGETMLQLHVIIVLTLSMVLAMSTPAMAVSGNDWVQLQQVRQEIYVAGVVDVYADIAALAKSGDLKDPLSSGADAISHCINEFGYVQLAAIVKKYMNNNPEQWHDSMSKLTMRALFQACQS